MNVGIRAAKGEFVITLNNDSRADSRFIEELIKPMADPEVGVCAAKMLFPDGRINSAGICISRSGAAWDRGMFEPDRGQYEFVEEVFGACAGAALYRREMLDEIGLFDEDFFLYLEDVDLAFRARLAGWKCLYVPGARVIHHHGGTAGIKDFPFRLLITSLPFIVARNLAVIPYYALRGQGGVILKSKLDALKGVVKMMEKRKDVVCRADYSQIKRFVEIWGRMKGH